MFSLLVSRLGMKSKLPGLTLAQEASYKGWDGGTRNLMAAELH
jgi:hypothetical protein